MRPTSTSRCSRPRAPASSRSTRCSSTRRTTSRVAEHASSPSTTSLRTTGARFSRSLTDNIVFAQHNLVSDHAFNEFNVIVCRNVMIYFDRTLQDRVHRLFYESLDTFGVLALGRKESVAFTPFVDDFEVIDAAERIYRRQA